MMTMKRLLAYIGVVLLACGCGLDEPVLPGAEELAVNSRSKSAKLRIFEKE